ncbi:hypothetical protein MVEN_02289200 [Mycena venus]|uniref:F-box domain-containing protein n=1 Tax=Mycena venus TaxID=2733690 RepID=A0A8H6X504_9AGAR|nr:hypothetical protein MVEN_02289200 [Mycena venus]
MPFQHLHLIQGDMPHVRKLTFGPSLLPPATEPLHLFDHAPQLTSVVLTLHFLKSLYHLPWVQLTHLNGHFLFERECAEILRDATNLVQCTFGVCDTDSENPSPIPEVPVHNHLRPLILHLGDKYQPVVTLSQLFDGLTLPALRSLHVYESGITLDSLRDFITRSCCILEELRILDSAEEEGIYREAFPFIRNITVEAVVGHEATNDGDLEE